MMRDERVNRREFLEKSGKAVGAVAALPGLLTAAGTAESAPVMPRRVLGRTGVSVSILAMGCGSRFLAYPADQATAVLEKAVGLGINYLDTAVDYGKGESETRVGRFLAARRRDVFVATKIPPAARGRDAAMREVGRASSASRPITSTCFICTASPTLPTWRRSRLPTAR